MKTKFKILMIAITIFAMGITASLAQDDTTMVLAVSDDYNPKGRSNAAKIVMVTFEECMAAYATLEKSRSEGVPFTMNLSNPDWTGYVNYLFCMLPDGTKHGDTKLIETPQKK